MDNMAEKTKNKRQLHPPPRTCAAKNSQRPVSVETVLGGVSPYGVIETLLVNGKSLVGGKDQSRQLTLLLPAVFGDEPVPGQRFAQSSLILNYCQNKLAKPNKYCFIPKERGTFLLSNCIKHHAM